MVILTIDQGWMREALRISASSTCASKYSVGCVIVPRHPAVPAVGGFNGVISQLPPCDHGTGYPGVRCISDGNGRCMRAIHAEQRALVNAAGRGVNVSEATMYVTLAPCFMCSQLIILSGITRVCYAGVPTSTNGLELLMLHVEVVKIELPEEIL